MHLEGTPQRICMVDSAKWLRWTMHKSFTRLLPKEHSPSDGLYL